MPPSISLGNTNTATGVASGNITIVAGTNFLVVTCFSGATVFNGLASLTVGGRACTRLRKDGPPAGDVIIGEIWYLVQPPSGITAWSLTWDGGTPQYWFLVFQDLSQVNLSAPFDANNGIAYSLNDGPGPNFTLNSRAGGMGIDIGTILGDAGVNLTLGVGQTQLGAYSPTTSFVTRTSYKVGAAPTINMSQAESGTSYGFTGSAVTLVPGAAGSQVLILAARRWQEFMRDLKRGLVPPDALRRRYHDLVTI